MVTSTREQESTHYQKKPEGVIDSYAYTNRTTLLIRLFRSSITSEPAVR